MEIIIGTILVVAYFIIWLRFFPMGRRTFDVFKLNPFLLPFWWKFVGITWLLFVIVYSIIQGNFDPSNNNFLLAGFYFGLLIISFSKEKNEDEFAQQTRMKSMYISIISLFFLIGIFSSFEITNPGSFSKSAFVWIMMLFNATLIVYLAYFYLTKYGFKK